ncbi:MAG: hypothetical protein AAB089_04880, partial [Nitrospirota bacterium]
MGIIKGSGFRGQESGVREDNRHNSLVEVEKGIKIIPGANTIITTLDKVVNWGRKNSIWPMTFGL